MKTLLLYVLGLFLAGMAFTAGRSAWQHHGDYVEFAIAAAFLVGAVAAFRAGARIMDSTKPPAN